MTLVSLCVFPLRTQWANYFRTTSEIEVAFWSSFIGEEKHSAKIVEQQRSNECDTSELNSKDECEVRTSLNDHCEQGSPVSEELLDDKEEMSSLEGSESPQTMESDEEVAEVVADSEGKEPLGGRGSSSASFPGAGLGVSEEVCSPELLHKSRLLTVEELLALFQKLAKGKGLSC